MAAVTRLGLAGGPRGLYGSFSGKVQAAPVFTGTISNISIGQGGSSESYDLAAYFTGATSYSISPAVETGWTFNTTTGLLTVNPLVVGGFGTYVVTGSNAGGTTDSNAFSVTVTESSSSGGFWTAYDAEMQRREEAKKLAAELKSNAKKIKEKLERELVEELLKLNEKEDRVIELKRLAQLAWVHQKAIKQSLSDRVVKAAERAVRQGNFSAMEAFDRELGRAREEELFLIAALEIVLNEQ